jgi:hypothetical protein
MQIFILALTAFLTAFFIHPSLTTASILECQREVTAGELTATFEISKEEAQAFFDFGFGEHYQNLSDLYRAIEATPKEELLAVAKKLEEMEHERLAAKELRERLFPVLPPRLSGAFSERIKVALTVKLQGYRINGPEFKKRIREFLVSLSPKDLSLFGILSEIDPLIVQYEKIASIEKMVSALAADIWQRVNRFGTTDRLAKADLIDAVSREYKTGLKGFDLRLATKLMPSLIDGALEPLLNRRWTGAEVRASMLTEMVLQVKILRDSMNGEILNTYWDPAVSKEKEAERSSLESRRSEYRTALFAKTSSRSPFPNPLVGNVYALALGHLIEHPLKAKFVETFVHHLPHNERLTLVEALNELASDDYSSTLTLSADPEFDRYEIRPINQIQNYDKPYHHDLYALRLARENEPATGTIIFGYIGGRFALVSWYLERNGLRQDLHDNENLRTRYDLFRYYQGLNFTLAADGQPH